jgi:hypothetical protein
MIIKSAFDSSPLDEFGGHLAEFILPIKSSPAQSSAMARVELVIGVVIGVSNWGQSSNWGRNWGQSKIKSK